jgi:hypothetical protein
MASEPKHDNEQIFLRAATTDEAFRQALHHKDRHEITEALHRLGIKVADIKAVVDEIVKVNWGELYTLEKRLTGAEVRPEN